MKNIAPYIRKEEWLVIVNNKFSIVCLCVNAECTSKRRVSYRILLTRKTRTTDNRGEICDFELENAPNRELPLFVSRRVVFVGLLDMPFKLKSCFFNT